MERHQIKRKGIGLALPHSTQEGTMNTVSRITICRSNILFLSLTVGLGIVMGLPGISLAEPKQGSTYNQCACLCDGPTGGEIDVITNSGGFGCDAYNSQTCNYTDPKTGGVNTGKEKYCTGFKPGGTRPMRSMMLPRTGMSGTVMSRGIEGEGQASSGEIQEQAVPVRKLGEAMMSCSCEKGSGSCSVTSKDGKTSTCEKGQNDTCTGTCAYPKGTISGFSGGLMAR